MSPSGAGRAQLLPPPLQPSLRHKQVLSVVSSAGLQSGRRAHCFRAETPPAQGTPNTPASDPQTRTRQHSDTRRNTLPGRSGQEWAGLAARGSSACRKPTWALAAPCPAPSPRPGHPSYRGVRSESHGNYDLWSSPFAPPKRPAPPPSPAGPVRAVPRSSPLGSRSPTLGDHAPTFPTARPLGALLFDAPPCAGVPASPALWGTRLLRPLPAGFAHLCGALTSQSALATKTPQRVRKTSLPLLLSINSGASSNPTLRNVRCASLDFTHKSALTGRPSIHHCQAYTTSCQTRCGSFMRCLGYVGNVM